MTKGVLARVTAASFLAVSLVVPRLAAASDAMDFFHPANPLNPLSPMNPLNPMSPTNPNGLFRDDDRGQRVRPEDRRIMLRIAPLEEDPARAQEEGGWAKLLILPAGFFVYRKTRKLYQRPSNEIGTPAKGP